MRFHGCNRGRHGPRAARARLRLHATLVGAHTQAVGLALGHKVHIDPLRSEGLVQTDCAPQALNIHRLRTIGAHDEVRHAGVDIVALHLLPLDIQHHSVGARGRLGHPNLDVATIHQLGIQQPAGGLHRHHPGGGTNLVGEPGGTTRAIAAHRHLGAIGVQEAHPEVGTVGLLDEDNTLAAHAGPPRGQETHQHIVLPRHLPLAIVEHHEVIGRTMHLGKL